jgi:hypothetical protein
MIELLLLPKPNCHIEIPEPYCGKPPKKSTDTPINKTSRVINFPRGSQRTVNAGDCQYCNAAYLQLDVLLPFHCF